MARSLHADTDAIINRLRRLARQCLAAHADLRQNCTLNESLAADGVRAFTGSQFFPCDVTVLAGRDSRYLYGFDYALLRRSGRMTRKQRADRERIEREVVFDPNATQLSFSRVLDLLVRIPFKRGRGRVLWTDKHHAYVRAWERHAHVQNMQERELLRHSRVSSFAPRTRSNPLFVVNYFEREIRKDRADHHRETVCFARNVCDMLGRLAIYMLHHNVLKPFHVTGSATPSPSAAVAQSHATVAGIPPEEQCAALERLLTQRRFLSRVSLSPSEELLWVRGFPTPLARRAEYVPKYALD
jgi:hypothetical protein